jgi:Flp pilus assembly protein CpaB
VRVPLALALRRRPRLRRALALAVAGLAGLLVQRTVAGAEAVRDRWGPRRAVLVATRDLPPGHVVDDGDLRTVELPPAAVPDDALDAAAGRVVRALVLEGEVLGRRRLAGAGVEGVAALLPEGTRAVAVPIEPATAPPLRVGQRVDLVAVVGSDASIPAAVVVAAAVPVVAVREAAVTVAVDRATAPKVAAALGAGTVTVAVVAPAASGTGRSPAPRGR